MKLIFFFLVLFVSFSIPSIFSSDASSLHHRKEYLRRDEFLSQRWEKISHDESSCLDLASLYKDRGEYKKALKIMEEFISHKKWEEVDSEIKKFLAYLYYLRGNSEKALVILKELKGRAPQDTLINLYLGLVYQDLDKLSLAKKCYLEALNLGGLSLASYQLGKIFYKEKKFLQAIKYFKETIQIDPSIRLAYYYLADSFFREKKYSSAYRFFSKAVNFYPLQVIKERLKLTKEKLGKKFFFRWRQLQEKRRKKIKLLSYHRVKGNIPEVKVKILEGVKEFTFKCGNDFKIYGRNKIVKAKGEKFYSLCVEKGRISLRVYGSKREITLLTPPLKITATNYPFYILDVTYGAGEFWQRKVDNAYRGDLQVTLKEGKIIVINVLNLEEYLYGVVPAEIYANSPLEALKAQAVISRTIALKNLGRHKKEGFDFCSEVHCQVYRGLNVESSLANKAVDETRGEVIVYENAPIEAFYHANCGGCLRGELFGRREYLPSNLRDSEDKPKLSLTPWEEERWFREKRESLCSQDKNSNFRWQRVYDREDFKLVFGYSLEELERITVKSRGDCLHVKEIEVEIEGKVEQIRGDLKIRNFFDNLKSSAFKIEIKYIIKDGVIKPNMLIFWGAGFGHGVGMCQRGAVALAEKGYSYKDIIFHYYDNVEIRKYYGK
ncbi:MAG: SpoIID/LytB domain-containing protein [Candidatus Omnitrophica bacterium]|nr:SpoIID/LytB domain-containing protein [Candidatus Omnitrophota bacterium]